MQIEEKIKSLNLDNELRKKIDNLQLRNIEVFSIEDLKLLSILIKQGLELPYYLGNNRVAHNIFVNANNFSDEEFNYLLRLFEEKESYTRQVPDLKYDTFSCMLMDFNEKVFRCVDKVGMIPKCLIENTYFRDECIRRNRIDLAIQCILPSDIINNEDLAESYCKELGIDKKTLYSRLQWISKYYQKNNNVFNTFLSIMLKDDIFDMPEHHLDRIINDVNIQMAFSRMTPKELKVILIIFKRFDYKDFDVSFMLSNVINNINNYRILIETLDINNLNQKSLNNLISILQNSKNIYEIESIEGLENLKTLKREKYLAEKQNDDINIVKENLCQYIFNLNLAQALMINKKYCYNKTGICIIDKLKESELPEELFNIIKTIHDIVETGDRKLLSSYFEMFSDNQIYDSPIPLETFFRSQYSKLYSSTLYKVESPIKVVDGVPSKIFRTVEYNGQQINVCIPRDSFNFLVHCVGTCANEGETIDSNYRIDWEERPQLQDHFVACSYLNEQKLYSFRAGNVITYGFNNLEGGALCVMGDCDIDSIGTYSKKYSAASDFMIQGGISTFLVPSLMIEFTKNGYNEFVIERRNYGENSEHFKRCPDYIVMSVDDVENNNNFVLLNNILQRELDFLTDDEKTIIKQMDGRQEIKLILQKYLFTSEMDEEQQKTVLNKYLDKIMKAKYYEQNLKASSEFGIPLVVIDRLYYFKKILNENNNYDEQTKINILNLYLDSNEVQRKRIFNAVSRNDSYELMISKTSNKSFNAF